MYHRKQMCINQLINLFIFLTEQLFQVFIKDLENVSCSFLVKSGTIAEL